MRVLVLAPHTDDGEFGCGGTIARFVETGEEIFYVAFSDCKQSLPPGWSSDALLHEWAAATRQLGIPKQNLINFAYPVRRFNEHRQSILEDLVKLNRELKPNMVLMPCVDDLHQDHQAIAAEGLRAFKHSSIMSYEVPWNNIVFEARGFICLQKEHVEAKCRAIAEYVSQRDRSYCNPEFVRSLAITRGVQIGVPFAEAFQVTRFVLGNHGTHGR